MSKDHYHYDLLGEPVAPDVSRMHEFYLGCIEAIRSVDPTHVIVLEGNEWGKRADSLTDELFADPQVTYSPHFYHSHHPPFGSIDTFPATVDGVTYGRDQLEEALSGYIDQGRIQRPVVMGEFGIYTRMPHLDTQVRILDEVVGLFEGKLAVLRKYALGDP